MTLARQSCPGGSWFRLASSAATLLTLLIMAGCTRLDARTSTVSENPAPARAAPALPPPRPVPTLAAIVDELQLGHYDQGEQDLRQHLQQHPGDRRAQAMLHQLVADPEQALGPRSQAYVVQAGDSYSTLAARYMGDPGAFLILARYNGSTHPAMLRVGERIRLPVSSAGAGELPTAKAQRLQRESVSLLDQGQNDQALARLGEALAIEPRLKPAGLHAAALRDQLLGSYHEQALALYRDNRPGPAIALWNRILAIDPDNGQAARWRSRALELKSRPKPH